MADRAVKRAKDLRPNDVRLMRVTVVETTHKQDDRVIVTWSTGEVTEHAGDDGIPDIEG